MTITYFDRYSKLRNNGSIAYIPYVKIEINDNSDIYDVFDPNSDSLFNWSNKYYNNPNYFFLILLANPEYSSLTYSIPKQTILRIPFPFNSALERYNKAVNKYLEYNSIE